MNNRLTNSRPLIAAIFVGAAALWPISALADAASEITTAATHAGLAAGQADINGVHTHLHHALNCLVGPGGNGFDKSQLNPCANAGSGAIPDTTDATKKAELEKAADMARAGLASDDYAAAKKDATALQTALKAMK